MSIVSQTPYTQPYGILAIWNDCTAGREEELETWYQQEHLIERLAVPGIVFGRRHEVLIGSPRYFTFYVTETVDTLFSEQYIERLDNPTPRTKAIMSEAFQNMSRTICRRETRSGNFRGSTVVTSRFRELPDFSGTTFAATALLQEPGIASVELWRGIEQGDMAVAEEERLRGGDQKIGGCLIIETLQPREAEKIAIDLSRTFPSAETGAYRVLCEIGNGQM